MLKSTPRWLIYSLAVLLVAAGSWIGYCALTPRHRPNVVIFLLDTLRADHLELYGYPEVTAPNLTKFARENGHAKFALSTAPWTPASVASILSGTFVDTHRYMPPRRSSLAIRKNFGVSDHLPILPEVLRNAGYYTAGFSSNGWIVEELGFARGFDLFRHQNGIKAHFVTDQALRMLEGAMSKKKEEKDKPFFLYLHYLDPHDPYEPPARFDTFDPQRYRAQYPEQQANDIAKYNGEISFLDEQVERVLSALKQAGAYDDTLIFIVGDHGEQFMEHGFRFHGNQVYATETWVPLIYRLGKDQIPGQAIDHTVSTADIFSTIMSYAGIDSPHSAALSIPLDAGRERHAQRGGVLSEMRGNLQQKAFTDLDGNRLFVGSNKASERFDVDDPTQHVMGMYAARQDPSEKTILTDNRKLVGLQRGWDSLQGIAQQLGDELHIEREDGGKGDGAISDKTIEQLKSLGYLQ